MGRLGIDTQMVVKRVKKSGELGEFTYFLNFCPIEMPKNWNDRLSKFRRPKRIDSWKSLGDLRN